MDSSTTTIGTSIVSTVVNAIKDFATGVSGTAVDVFNKVFVNSDGGLSNFAIWGLVIGALGIGFSLIRMFTRKAG